MVIVRMGRTGLPGTYAEQEQLWDGFFARLADALAPTRTAARPGE